MSVILMCENGDMRGDIFNLSECELCGSECWNLCSMDPEENLYEI